MDIVVTNFIKKSLYPVPLLNFINTIYILKIISYKI